MTAHERSAAGLPPGLLDRETEQAALRAVLESAAGRLVVVEGPAGIGKTTLLHDARVAAADRGFDVLTARGGELESSFAFGIVRQLFELRLGTADAEARAQLLSGAAEMCASLFAARSASETAPRAESTFAVLHGLYWLVANLALRGPTLLVVDDAQWADEPSLAWLTYLARRLDGLPLVVLVGTRPPVPGTAGRHLGQLVEDPDAVVVRPGPLGAGAATLLVRERLEAEPDGAFVDALKASSGGNPLLLRALIDSIDRLGLAPVAENAGRVRELGPTAVVRSVAGRLAQLPDDATELLRAAAILGSGTDLAVVAVVAGLDASGGLAAADGLVGAGLLAGGDPVEFTHPVIRTAVLEDMPSAARARASRRAAEALAEHDPAGAGTHLLRTLPDHDPWVVDTLRRGAAEAEAYGATAAAATFLARALEEPPSPSERAAVLGALGVAELVVGGSGAAEHLRAALDEGAADGGGLVVAYVQALIARGDGAQAAEVAAAIEERGAAPEDLRRRLEGLLVVATENTPELYPLGADAVARVPDDFSPGGPGAALLLAACAAHHGRRAVDHPRAVAFASRALAGGLTTSQDLLFSMHAAYALTMAGLTDAAGEGYAAAVATARRRGDVFTLAVLHLFRALLRIHEGRLLHTEEDLSEAAASPLGHPDMFATYHAGFLGETLLERGQLEAAARAVADPTAVARDGHDVHLRYARGRVALALGRPERALTEFRACAEAGDALGYRNPMYAPWRSGAALALARLGDPAEARALAGEELAVARSWTAPRAIGVALRTLALVSGEEDMLRESVDVLAASTARLEHARSLVELGALLRRTNRRREARPPLRDGVELAARCSAEPLVARGNEELAATGARPRTVMQSGAASLTASERRVAQLAADGQTNKEIAQTLFVTVKTVEQHLGRAYSKLDIGSRRDIAAALG